MIKTMPHSSSTYSICDNGVAGFSTTPAVFPRSRICDKCPVQMDRRARLAMDDQVIGAGAGEIFEVTFGLDDHQMDIDRLLRRLAHGLDDDRADRDVRDEAPVHDIDMDPIGPRPVDRVRTSSASRPKSADRIEGATITGRLIRPGLTYPARTLRVKAVVGG